MARIREKFTWTEALERRLLAARAEGVSYPACARRLGTNATTIRRKIEEMRRRRNEADPVRKHVGDGAPLGAH